MNLPQPVPVDKPTAYHHGGYSDPGRRDTDGRPKALPLNEREVIAWDMEGMSLSGDNKPQHPVLFGCSAHDATPMVGRNLTTLEMLNYVIAVGCQHPQAIHVGYHFNYDANMMLRDLPESSVAVLWKRNHVRFKVGGYCWTVQYYPGKKFVVTRADTWKRSFSRKNRTTVTIYDYSSFFGGQAFLTAAENILREDLTQNDREVIEHGKAERGNNSWADLESVRHYWQREIILVERVFRRFRDVMYQAGFALKEWYGPGALANYINTVRSIKPHIAAAQTTTGALPDPVHEASKIAFSGGRFEAFQLGYTEGPIYAVDINSAYPHALRMIPSLAAGNGRWRHVENPERVERFGFYRIEFSAPNAVPVEFRPMPLWWRDHQGLISYPNHVVGWYASPEARIVQGMPGVRITEGWFWDYQEEGSPWSFLADMYETRQRLGKENLLSIPFKLGPNSLYGKYAQTVGWDEDNCLPPKWHALPIAAWVTSMCRAMLWGLIRQAPDKVVAVETDSAFLTVDPSTLRLDLGDGLGQWSTDVYDAVVYLQSGMYLTNKDGEWTGVRSRGISRSEFNPTAVLEHLRSLRPGTEWQPFKLITKPRFVGMGSALAGTDFAGTWRTWQRQEKDITFGESGKRRHDQRLCHACSAGMTPMDGPHRSFIFSGSDGMEMSHPRALPWERRHPGLVERFRDAMKLEREAA